MDRGAHGEDDGGLQFRFGRDPDEFGREGEWKREEVKDGYRWPLCWSEGG